MLEDVETHMELPRSVHINKLKRYIPATCTPGDEASGNLHDKSLPVRLPLPASRTDIVDGRLADSHQDTAEMDHPSTDSDSDVDTPASSTEAKPDQTIPDTDTSDHPDGSADDSASDISSSDESDDESTDTKQLFQIDKVTRVRTGPDGLDQYYVSFKDYPKKYNQWVLYSDMSPALQQRVKRLKLKRAKTRFC